MRSDRESGDVRTMAVLGDLPNSSRDGVRVEKVNAERTSKARRISHPILTTANPPKFRGILARR